MRMIVGVSGASGVLMGHHLVKALRQVPDCEIHLVVTKGAKKTWELEVPMPLSELEDLADFVHDDQNLAATISSGSFVTSGMIVAPCSMKSLSAIANGYAANLLARAADVCLKEGRKVVLMPREMPLSKIHLRNLTVASDAGCSIVPPMLTLYNNPENLTDQIEHVVGKVLMQFGLEHKKFTAWRGASSDEHLSK